MHWEQVSAIIFLANSGEPVANDLVEQLVLRQFWPSFAAEEEHRISQFVGERVGHLEGPAMRGGYWSRHALDPWGTSGYQGAGGSSGFRGACGAQKAILRAHPEVRTPGQPASSVVSHGSHRHSANAEQLADDLSVLRIADPARIVPADR